MRRLLRRQRAPRPCPRPFALARASSCALGRAARRLAGALSWLPAAATHKLTARRTPLLPSLSHHRRPVLFSVRQRRRLAGGAACEMGRAAALFCAAPALLAPPHPKGPAVAKVLTPTPIGWHYRYAPPPHCSACPPLQRLLPRSHRAPGSPVPPTLLRLSSAAAAHAHLLPPPPPPKTNNRNNEKRSRRLLGIPICVPVRSSHVFFSPSPARRAAAAASHRARPAAAGGHCCAWAPRCPFLPPLFCPPPPLCACECPINPSPPGPLTHTRQTQL